MKCLGRSDYLKWQEVRIEEWNELRKVSVRLKRECKEKRVIEGVGASNEEGSVQREAVMDNAVTQGERSEQR